jgi:hypothetical protein
MHSFLSVQGQLEMFFGTQALGCGWGAIRIGIQPNFVKPEKFRASLQKCVTASRETQLFRRILRDGILIDIEHSCLRPHLLFLPDGCFRLRRISHTMQAESKNSRPAARFKFKP